MQNIMTYVTYLILVSPFWLCPGNHLSRNNIQVAYVYSLGLPAGSKLQKIPPKSGAISPGNQRDHHTPTKPPHDHAGSRRLITMSNVSSYYSNSNILPITSNPLCARHHSRSWFGLTPAGQRARLRSQALHHKHIPN